MEWCGLSWRHLIVLGFLYTVCMGLFAATEGIGNTYNNVYNGLFDTWYEDIDAISLWTSYYCPVFASPLVIVAGFAMMDYGRFAVVYGTLVFCVLISPLVIRPLNITMMASGMTIINAIVEPILMGGIFIYAYESVPVKYRRIAVISLGALSSFGRLGFGISRELSGSAGYMDTNKPIEQLADECSIIIGLSMAVMIIPLIFGLFIRKDSPVSLVIRGFERSVYKQLVSWRNTPESGVAAIDDKPPMTEDDFVYQVEIERERSFTDFKTMVVRKWPALLFLFLTGYSYQLAGTIFLTPYKYLAYDYIGGGYEASPIKGILVFNSCCFLGTIAAIIYIHKFKTITFVPGLAISMMFIGATINATEQVFYDNGNPIEYQVVNIMVVLVGQVFIWVGFTLSQFIWGLLIVEIVGGKYRPIFVMGQMALRNVTGAIIDGLYFKYAWDGLGIYIVASVLLGIISIAYFYVFLATNWFSRHDPAEEDECDIAIDVLDEDELYIDEDGFVDEKAAIATAKRGPEQWGESSFFER